jgi:BirA family biotin operon repressor/biotin-[acetyl-CoA-carboxylase] ligase
MAHPLRAPDLLYALAGMRFGHPLYTYARLGSTNDAARRLAEAGAPEGLLVVAETQIAGRGRAGRRWITPPGSALALSLVLRPPVPPAQAARLTMLAGVAVCEAIEATAGIAAALKWPNDVLVRGGKAGGILVETGLSGDRLDYAVVGIGLNVSAAPPPEAVDFPAAALSAAGAPAPDRARLVGAIAARLEAHYAGLAQAEALHAAWAARLAWLGEVVTAHTAQGVVAGQAERVDADGALVIRLAGGEARRIVAGDVRLRRAEAAGHGRHV